MELLRQINWSGGRAARLLRSWVQIPPGAWIFVCCECRVLSVRGLCDELITRPEESYRMCCVVVCDLETSRMGAPYIYDISRLRIKVASCRRKARRASSMELCHFYYSYSLLECFPQWYVSMADKLHIHTYIRYMHACIHTYRDTLLHIYIRHTYIHKYVRAYIHT